MAITLLVTKYFLIGSLITAGIIGFINLLCVITDKLHICKDSFDSFVAFFLLSILLGFAVFVVENAGSKHKQPPQNTTPIERSATQNE